MEEASILQRIRETLDRLAAVERSGGIILTPASHCPYCTRPEGWDACPIHDPTPPPTPHAQG